MGKIIWLNGVSSSGKTTLAKVLQNLLPEQPYYISNDLFAEMIPSKCFSDAKKADESFSMMHNIIKMFSDLGIDIIVDSLFLSAHRMNQCVEALHEYPVLFVHVTCPADELRRREEKRGDRKIGQGENQLARLNPQDKIYDLTVDTHNNLIDECANRIIELLNYPNKFTAFKILWEQRPK